MSSTKHKYSRPKLSLRTGNSIKTRARENDECRSACTNAAALGPVHFCIYALANQDHFNQIEPSHATRPFLSKFYEKCESCVLSANESQRMVVLVAPPTLLWFPWGKENEEKILTVAKLPVFRPIFLDFAFSWTSLSRAKTNFRPFGIFCYVIAKCRKGIISRNWNLGQLFSRPTDWLSTFPTEGIHFETFFWATWVETPNFVLKPIYFCQFIDRCAGIAYRDETWYLLLLHVLEAMGKWLVNHNAEHNFLWWPFYSPERRRTARDNRVREKAFILRKEILSWFPCSAREEKRTSIRN